MPNAGIKLSEKLRKQQQGLKMLMLQTKKIMAMLDMVEKEKAKGSKIIARIPNVYGIAPSIDDMAFYPADDEANKQVYKEVIDEAEIALEHVESRIDQIQVEEEEAKWLKNQRKQKVKRKKV